MHPHRPLIATVAAALTGALAVTVLPALAGAADTPRWTAQADGAWFKWSSPVIADVNHDGSNDVVVGGGDGKVYAYNADGQPVGRWPKAAMAPVASSPAVGDVDGDGRNDVVVGAGFLEAPQRGGLTVLKANGQRCDVVTSSRHGTGPGSTSVFNAPAIGDIDGDGDNEIVFGAWDHYIYAVDGNCNVLDRFEQKDSVWSAPALWDIDGIAGMEIFIGGDATAGGDPHSGGYFRSLTWNGSKLVQRWVRLSDETFQSAAAIGDINHDGRMEVVTGSGSDYCRWKNRCSADSRRVFAFHLDDGSDVPGWPKQTTFNGHFLAAPALGDINGDGKTDVVLGTTQYNSGGTLGGGAVNAFLGGSGQRIEFAPKGEQEWLSPPVIADVDGGGTAEVVVGMSSGFVVLDGNLSVKQDKLGNRPGGGWLVHPNAAAVGELGGGRFALVTAGSDPGDGNKGYVSAYDVPKPTSAPWPQFRKNSARMGADLSALGAPRVSGPPAVPVSPPSPSTTTTKAKPKLTPTTKRPAPPTTAAPPPPETTTTLAPVTTTLPPEMTTTAIEDTTELVELAGRESDGDGGGGAGPLVALLGLLAVGGGGLFFGWRRLHQG